VSELTTNAIAATRATETGLPVRLWLLSDGKQVLILVWDVNPNPPVRMQPDDYTEGGRGLMLVDAMSERWGWYATPDMIEGKVVWALISG
jgi:anti-sigma regulatory factor (Ser/Thr protein kinase)